MSDNHTQNARYVGPTLFLSKFVPDHCQRCNKYSNYSANIPLSITAEAGAPAGQVFTELDKIPKFIEKIRGDQ